MKEQKEFRKDLLLLANKISRSQAEILLFVYTMGQMRLV
ncbi:hypothetical protein BN927_01044 [Lactococcus lactis subsp. lactis Dephy 1]|nr:hypothetical protein BN927_01044 [Lactococcus lactis subsp. lactis Dephy 1]